MELSSEISSIKEQIRSGKFEARITSSTLTDGNGELARSVNEILDLYQQEIRKIIGERDKKGAECEASLEYAKESMKIFAEHFSLLAGGEVTRPIHIQAEDVNDNNLKQSVRELMEAYNRSQSVLTDLERKISDISGQVETGNPGQYIDVSLYSGIYKKIAIHIRTILETVKMPVNEAMRVCSQFAAYDFSARFDDSIQAKGELKEFKNSLNVIGSQVTDAFRSINQQVMELSSNVEEANASVSEVAHSSEQVSKNSNAVSENTEQSDAGVRQVLRAMEDLSVTVGDVSQKAESVSRLAHDGTQMAREGSEFAKKAEQGMNLIITSAEEADHLIGNIQGEMKKINEIVRLITDIANQTNLLALNAAIEAARAGDMGRGFAVVATEVKALALESRNSAEKITDMIGNLQKQSQSAANAVTGATLAVRDGNLLLSDTLSVFGRLAESVEEISMNIEQVASMNEEQAAAVEEITSSMHEVSAMLKDTAKEAVDSATATNETSVSVHQLKGNVDTLAGIAERISESMIRFTF